MTVSFETRIPSGRARRRESICEALPPMKYESRRLVPRVKVRASIPKVSWRSGPTYAYEWSTALDAGDPVHLLDPVLEAALGDRPGRRRDHDIGSQGELGVDAGLLVVGGGEDPEVDAEGEQKRVTTSPRLIAAPRLPALASRNPAGLVARFPAARRAIHATARPRARTSSSVAPIQSRAGARNM